jgi:hypothetical protein
MIIYVSLTPVDPYHIRGKVRFPERGMVACEKY